MDYENVNWIDLKLNPNKSAAESIAKMESSISKISFLPHLSIINLPTVNLPQNLQLKHESASCPDFSHTGNIHQLPRIIRTRILCSRTTHQRNRCAKSTGCVRIYSVWKMLSKDFVILVIISMAIVYPTAYYFMHQWLQNYPIALKSPGGYLLYPDWVQFSLLY